jgi:tetratricopeptide (TPR) repeat protein
VKTFKQYWYPVKDIQGFKNANLNGAVNLEKRDGNKVFLGYYSTSKIGKAKIILKKKGETVFEKTVEISPEKAFTQTIKMEGEFALTDLSTEMINSENQEHLVAYQPVEPNLVTKLPEEVKRPALPKDMATVEELYLTGSRILQFHNPTLNAMDYFSEALKRDAGDIRTNTAVGNMHLKNGEYEQAQKHFRTAIKRLTKDYTRPSTCEALYLQGLTLKTLGKYEAAIDTLYRATWDYAWHSAAYLELARISCFRNDYQKALEQVEQSLSTNIKNNSAINLKASILRKLGKFDEAKSLLEPVLATDPLDFRAGNELFLISKAKNEAKSDELLASLDKKMRGFNQNYLELAVAYLNDYLPEDAEAILRRFSGKDQMVSYYLGFLHDKKGNKTEAGKYYADASAQSVDYGFPFRLEDEKVLKSAATYRPNDAKPMYYLGNLLYDKQPQRAIEYWEKAVKLEPTLAIAWRNLGFGYYHTQNDIPKAIAAYEKAYSLKKDEPVYYAELDPLYERNNTPIETRAKLFEGVNDIVKARDDAFVREIMVLNLSGQPEKSVEYLGSSVFHFREGSSRVSDMKVDAHLLLGIKYLAYKKNDAALAEFLKTTGSKADNENADARDPQINYFIGLAYEALGKKADAKSYFGKSGNQEVKETGIISYYKGLSLQKLGNKAKATEIFEALIAEGNKRMSKETEVDFFAKFGEKEAENVRLSNANMLIGLGNKGLGNTAKANESLKKAVELSASNLWAEVESRN